MNEFGVIFKYIMIKDMLLWEVYKNNLVWGNLVKEYTSKGNEKIIFILY